MRSRTTKFMQCLCTALAVNANISPACSCGFTEEDQSASIYSYKNLQLARAKGRELLSMTIEGLEGPETFQRIVKDLKHDPRVVAGTVVSNYDQRAVGFVAKTKKHFPALSARISKQNPKIRLVEIPDFPPER